MQRTFVGLGLVLVGALGFALFFRDHPATGQIEPKVAAKLEKRTLTTAGSATVRVKPDMARLYFRVETTGPTVADARTRNNGQVKTVLDALQALPILNLKMKTTDVSMTIVHSKVEKQDEIPRVLGYQVTTTFTALVTSNDVGKLAGYAGKVLDVALEKGANGVDRVHFFRQDLTEAKREALTKGTENALANARALAEGAGRTITDVTTIDGNPSYSRPTFINAVRPGALAGDGLSGTSLVAGEEEVTCEVSVTCTFGPGKN